jgi:phosphate transport system substrate-binding protein
MNLLKRIGPLLTTAAICFLTSVTCAQTPQQLPAPSLLIAAGSGANLEITRLLANAFMKYHPRVTIEVPGSIGSKGAITAVTDGAITFGLISRPLKADETSPGLVTRPFAIVPIVVGAHAAVADNEITFQDLVDIYRGTKTRWKDGNEIIVLSREPFDSGFQMLEKEIPGFREAIAESRQAKRWTVSFTDQEANRALLSTRYAIGISDLGMILTEGLDIKVLKLNGVIPGPESLLRGQYPLKRELSFLYREGTLPEEAKAFLDFVSTEEGAGLLKSNGYLPLNSVLFLDPSDLPCRRYPFFGVSFSFFLAPSPLFL